MTPLVGQQPSYRIVPCWARDTSTAKPTCPTVVAEIWIDALAEVLRSYRLDECIGRVEANNGAVGVRGGIALLDEEDLVSEQTRPPAIRKCICGLDYSGIHGCFRPSPVLAVKSRTQVALGEWIGLRRIGWVGGRPAAWSAFSAGANSGDKSGHQEGAIPRVRQPENDVKKQE